MKILSLLDQLGNLPAAPAARRTALAQLGNASWRAAAAALPLIGAMAVPASAKTAGTMLDGIRLLLLLEQAQLALYTQALASSVLPLAARPDFVLLQTQQRQHTEALGRMLTEAALPVPAAPTFDFSGRHNTPANPELFPNVFTSYTNFLELAQQLEDAGVRIYMGQLPTLASERLIYAAAIGMHATEARHAAHLRTLRREAGAVVKSWPSTADAALPHPFSLTLGGLSGTLYASSGSTGDPKKDFDANKLFETNTNQTIPGPAAIPFDTLLTVANGLAVPSTAVAEAFDEPLPTAAAQAVLALFS